MKSVSIIKHAATLSTTDADKLRERLKGQFAEGLVLLDGRLDYLGTVVLPEPSAAVELIPAPTEAGSGSPFTIVRRSRSAASLAEIKAANLVYIDEKAPEEIRRRTIQRRRELYEDAQGYYNSMLDVLDLAFMSVNREKLPANVLKEWVGKITDEISQISKIKRSDKSR